MIAIPVVDEVRRLLAEGRLSQRAIARRLAISHGTVGAIARGRRVPKPSAEAESLTPPTGPIVRCRRCGGLVLAPCLACRVRDWKRATNRSGDSL